MDDVVIVTPETPTEEVKAETTAIATQPQSQMMMSLQPKNMREVLSMAKMYAGASIAPQAYRNKPNDCFVAINMAVRMNVDPMFVMQNSYIVSGNFTWSGQACISLINNCGRFYPLDFEETFDPETGDFSCVAFATEKRTGEVKKSTKVDKKLAEDCGWFAKNGTYWKKMPQQMARYRSAAFFARAYCPEALGGFYTSDEMADIKGTAALNNNTVKFEMEEKK